MTRMCGFFEGTMRLALLLPLLLGFAAVLQAGLNRQIARQWGLGGAVLFNSLVLTTTAVVFLWILVAYLTDASSPLRPRIDWSAFRIWFLIPGLAGLSLLLGIPFLIAKIGALQTVVFLIAGQLIGSLFWDAWVESVPITPLRVTGAFVALSGALITWRATLR